MKAVKLLILLPAVFFWEGSFSQEYSILKIPPELKEEANAVVRKDILEFEVRSPNDGKQRVELAITILNEKAKSYAYLVVGYDDFRKVNIKSARVYDKFGKEVRKLKKSEFEDVSADRSSIASDSRAIVADMRYSQYPYTIEYEYEINYSGLLHFPTWTGQPDNKTSVVKSSFKITHPSSLPVRYKTVNISEPAKFSDDEGKEILSWEVNRLKAFDKEPHSPPISDLVPMIYTAPSKFEIDGYYGDMNSWESIGVWVNLLNEGTDHLPPEIIQKVKEITKNTETEEEKVKVIYDYLQQNTRYVSIQLGIGGWKPLEAAYVNEKGFGDCKALSNYTIAMLKAAGIKSHYTLIRAGDNAKNIHKDFPSVNFNHVIVSVPTPNDTIWLECTSQTNPFGYLGKFTGDREALLITEKGGRIVHTPVYEQNENRQERSADVFIDREGHATATIETRYKGLQFENNDMNFYLFKGAEEQKRWILKKIDIPTFELKDFDLSYEGDYIPEATEKLKLDLRRYASTTGKRMFLDLNLMNKSTYIPKKLKERKTNIIRKFAYIDVDTIRYHLPDGLHPEYVPETVKYQSIFGEYEAKVDVEDGLVTFIRTIKMKNGEFPKESYEELREFYRNISKADAMKIVFLNST